MIPKIRALAIDDDADDLDKICQAAMRAGFGCVPLHYPQQTDLNVLKEYEFHRAHIRLVISDLHLSGGATLGSDDQRNFGIIAGLIQALDLPPWSPFVLILWTRHTKQAAKLKVELEKYLSAERLPSALVALDKDKYLKPGEEDALWKDLRSKTSESPGVRILLQWESELIRAADGVVRSLMRIARQGQKKEIKCDGDIDRVLSLLARSATSKNFSRSDPRSAANEALLPLLLDEIQHLQVTDEEIDLWKSALSAVQKGTIPTTVGEAAFFNEALLVARERVVTGADRGSVIDCWHNDEEFFSTFGKTKADLEGLFGLAQAAPADFAIKYIQVEGLCDSAQQKAGVVPFVLACEVPKDTALKSGTDGANSRPASVEVSPVYLDGDHGRKLIVNFRFFFTESRNVAKSHTSKFRLRESLINKWAFEWATHAIRPGLVTLDPPDEQPKAIPAPDPQPVASPTMGQRLGAFLARIKLC